MHRTIVKVLFLSQRWEGGGVKFIRLFTEINSCRSNPSILHIVRHSLVIRTDPRLPPCLCLELSVDLFCQYQSSAQRHNFIFSLTNANSFQKPFHLFWVSALTAMTNVTLSFQSDFPHSSISTSPSISSFIHPVCFGNLISVDCCCLPSSITRFISPQEHLRNAVNPQPSLLCWVDFNPRP